MLCDEISITEKLRANTTIKLTRSFSLNDAVMLKHPICHHERDFFLKVVPKVAIRWGQVPFTGVLEQAIVAHLPIGTRYDCV